MNILRINFPELYQRHLCRHGQYGNNVIHLLMVIGTYVGLFSIARACWDSPWFLLAIPVSYLLVLAFNIPLRVLMVSVLFVGLFFAMFLTLPEVPIWLAAGLIVVCYFLQNWSHKLYNKAADMTEFNKKYPKGPVLFVLLLIYEVPLLLNYLCFDTRNWVDVFPRSGYSAEVEKRQSAVVAD